MEEAFAFEGSEITVNEIPYDPNEPMTVWVPNGKPSWVKKLETCPPPAKGLISDTGS